MHKREHRSGPENHHRPDQGKVSVDGKPVTEGMITLEPLPDGGSTTQAVGPVQSDGSFVVGSAGGYDSAHAREVPRPASVRCDQEEEATQSGSYGRGQRGPGPGY